MLFWGTQRAEQIAADNKDELNQGLSLVFNLMTQLVPITTTGTKLLQCMVPKVLKKTL